MRMPTPINQLFNDKSSVVQILFLDVYTWTLPWIRWNTWLIGDGSEFKGYFVIFLRCFFKNIMVEIVIKTCTNNTYSMH